MASKRKVISVRTLPTKKQAAAKKKAMKKGGKRGGRD